MFYLLVFIILLGTINIIEYVLVIRKYGSPKTFFTCRCRFMFHCFSISNYVHLKCKLFNKFFCLFLFYPHYSNVDHYGLINTVFTYDLFEVLIITLQLIFFLFNFSFSWCALLFICRLFDVDNFYYKLRVSCTNKQYFSIYNILFLAASKQFLLSI